MEEKEELTQLTQPNLGNTKSQIRARAWCMTLNNYTEDEHDQLTQAFKKLNCVWIIGKEVGENGTPHLQIYIYCKNAISFNTIKKLNNRLHIEKAKGDIKSNIAYCSKENNYTDNIKKIKDPLNNKELRPFQQEIINILDTEPDERLIYWFYEKNGKVGKTALAKHLCLTRSKETLFLGGKGSDIKYGVKTFVDNVENDLKNCIFHFTRSVENYISYEALESIKDGIFYNSKYESGMVVFNSPHIIVLANFLPEKEKLSLDRWIIKEIQEDFTTIVPDC